MLPAMAVAGVIDHIGIAVRGIDAARVAWELLGFRFEGYEVLEDRKLRIGKLMGASGVAVELTEPLEGEQVISRFLARRGEGVHHICVRVGDIDSETDRLREAGFRPVYERAEGGSGSSRVNFLRPQETHGVLLELSERDPLAEGSEKSGGRTPPER